MPATSRPLSVRDADALGRELDAIRDEIIADLGDADLEHMRRVVRIARLSEAAGRGLLHVGFGPVTFAAGVGSLALSKVLENMEIGHNVLHGQYDWAGDPALASATYVWDIGCDEDDWRHSHNVEHHTWTNVIGLDRDVGYGFLRVSEEQPWHPVHLSQPFVAAGLALLFQWGVGLHDLRVDEVLSGRQSPRDFVRRARPFATKAAWQLGKDYVLFPALALWNAPRVFAGNLLANGIRNVWTFSVIFCGHFPDGVQVYHPSETEHETRGQWYVRQLNGSANLDGSRWFHVLTGHLSFQIEHHLFPDLPASRYPEIAPRVREICERYGQRYVGGPMSVQFGSVVRRILRLALPGRTADSEAAQTGTQGPAWAAAG